MCSARKLLFLALLLSLVPSVRAAEPDKLMPADAEVVAVLNVRKALDAPVTKKYALKLLEGAVASNPDLQKGLMAIGLNPFKDIDSVLVTVSGKLDNKEGNIFVGLRGSFNPDKIKAEAVKARLPSSQVGSLTIYEVKGEQDLFLAVLDQKTIVASNKKDYLVTAVSGGLKPSKNSAQLKAALARVDASHTLVVCTVLTDDIKKQLKELAPGNEPNGLVDKLESLSATINLTADADVKVVLNTADDKTATDLARMINAQLTTEAKDKIAKTPGVPPVVGPILDTLKVIPDKKSVVITLKVTDGMIGKALMGM